jgi:hypothetical protein
MAFDDFVMIDTGALLLGVKANARERDKKVQKSKNVEAAFKDGFISKVYFPLDYWNLGDKFS